MRFSGIAFEMLGFIAVGVWVGYKLDEYLELTIPVFLLSGSMLALAGSIIYLIRKLPKE